MNCQKTQEECSNDAGKRLLKCSRCQLVYYCSKECQKSHFPSHKRQCKELHGYKKEHEMFADMMITEARAGLQLPSVGDYGNHFITDPYLNCRQSLAQYLHNMIVLYSYHTRQAWTMVADHHQEILRLDAGDSLGSKSRFPFYLLKLNRDDDAYGFIRHWCQRSSGSRILSNAEEISKCHRESNQGEWLYGVCDDKDCRYLDILEECPNTHWHNVDTGLLMALACIKMRLVAVYESKKKRLADYNATSGAEVSAQIKESIMGDKDTNTKLEGQRAQLERILDIIQENNPTMLPALLFRGPMMVQDKPKETKPGHPSECYQIILDCCLIWLDIPGTVDILEARLGRGPQYDRDLSL